MEVLLTLCILRVEVMILESASCRATKVSMVERRALSTRCPCGRFARSLREMGVDLLYGILESRGGTVVGPDLELWI